MQAGAASAILIYVSAVMISNRSYRQWPVYRTSLWIAGICCIFFSVSGPVAERAHSSFTFHMAAHLLLGMLAPLLIALSAPVTLVLRSMNVKMARQVSSLLKSTPAKILADPFAASLLNMGGLWVLYTTGLYHAMHQHLLLFVFIHIHIFLAGLLFTESMLAIGPSPHKTSFVYRSTALVLALASHSILAKYLYGNPPSGVFSAEAEAGALLMYYGGDAIDLFIVFLLCSQWYRTQRSQQTSEQV
ncbi:cytochrome c oxidase assembly protein [Bacillus salacetis]|uniref:Cytochrome c oxidase assembly protein n=2 Tax=Bacillus salacetis TaxID=2315464 RepID=A0A3A1QUK1_9BACI|nr:cytochrome c oxidase assembly protein [Bacillus salacetis]